MLSRAKYMLFHELSWFPMGFHDFRGIPCCLVTECAAFGIKYVGFGEQNRRLAGLAETQRECIFW